VSAKPRNKAKVPAGRPSERAVGEKADEKRSDVVLIQGISADGEALAVLRAREDRVEAGIVRSVKEGEVGQGELLKLKPRPESPLVCDVEVQVPANTLNARGGSDAHHHGPAQVATRTYRENWDAIWKKPGKKSSLPN